MVVCQYFLRGNCRFGNTCRNEHPTNPRSGFGNPSWTNTNNTSKPILPFTLDTIKTDLATEKPIWPLSSYGPAKHEPNLISGLDESMEELRVRATLALKAGNVNEYIAYESGKVQAADQVFTNARNNLSQAYETATNQSPHTNKKPATSAFGSTPATTAPAFGQPGFNTGQQQQTSVFGQPSAPQSAFSALQQPSAQTGGAVFGQSSFGQAQAQPQSVFGQTSSFIKPASSAFSAFANTGPNSFATAANNNPLGGGFSSFAGQPSTFGTGNLNTAWASSGSAFGGGTAPTTGGFDTPAPIFGQSQPTQGQQSTFGALQNQPTSVFGQPSQQQQQNAPGTLQSQPQSTFGTLQTQPQSVFGAPSTKPQSIFGSGGGITSNPFIAPSSSSAGFTPLSNPANPLNSTPQGSFISASNPPAPPSTTFNAFSNGSTAPNPFTSLSSANNALPTTPSTFPSKNTNLLVNPTTKPDFLGALSRVKGQRGLTPYDSLLPPQYVSLLPQNVIEAFKSTRFEFGQVPDWVPPVELR